MGNQYQIRMLVTRLQCLESQFDNSYDFSLNKRYSKYYEELERLLEGGTNVIL